MDQLPLPEGVMSNFIGPPQEWILSHTRQEFDEVLEPFWGVVEDLLVSMPGSYEDLPEWMTEKAAQELEQNNLA